MDTSTLHPFTADEVAAIDHPGSPLNTAEPWLRAAFRFIKGREDYRSLPYYDLNDPVRAKATIGYGFNIESVNHYSFLVLWEMGVINANTTSAQYNQILNQCHAVMVDVKKDYTGPPENFKNECDKLLRQGLDAVVKSVSGNTVSTFSITENQSDSVFLNILLGSQKEIQDATITDDGMQKALDGYIGNSLAHESQEYVAIMSLYYNGPSKIINNQDLRNALKYDNRAEAWYQIRYNSNDAGGTWTSRRYEEANKFGLYDSGTFNEAESKEIMRMYTRYEVDNKKLSTYEDGHTQKPDKSIGAEVQDASTYLITKFANGNTIDGKVIVGGGLDSYAYLGENINDQLTGTKDKNDLIFGEKGNDTLDGSTGTDVMIGGDGNDTYKVDDPNDKIVEKDGEGKELVESTAADYTLPDNVENLTLMGKENINGTGNGLPNVIEGNTGNNILDGGGGNDTL